MQGEPAADLHSADAIRRGFVDWLVHEQRSSPHTASAYDIALTQFLDFLAAHRGQAQTRAWTKGESWSVEISRTVASASFSLSARGRRCALALIEAMRGASHSMPCFVER